MDTDLIQPGNPLGWELGRRRTELARLERALGERESELTAYLEALAAFERRYREALGPRYAALDALELAIAEKAAQARPDDASKQRKAERVKARLDAESRPAPQPPVAGKPKAPEDLKATYRGLSKLIHPDLASNEADRSYREALMVQANAAYAAGDHALLTFLQEGWALRHAPAPRGDEATLEHLMRQIEQAEKRLAQAEGERTAIEETPLAKLMKRAERAAKDGVDLFERLASELDEYEARLQKRLKTLSRRASRTRTKRL